MRVKSFIFAGSNQRLSWLLMKEITLFGAIANVPAVLSTDPNLSADDLSTAAKDAQLDEQIVWLSNSFYDLIRTAWVPQVGNFIGVPLIFPADARLWVSQGSTVITGFCQLFYDELS